MARTSEKLLAVARAFASVPSILYAAVYLFVLIPAFAIVYDYLLSGSFYHSTVPYEHSVRKEEQQIAFKLQQQIVETFRTKHKDTVSLNGSPNGWIIDADSFKVRSLKATADQVSFQLDMSLTNANEPGRRIYTAPLIKFPVMEWSEEVSANKPPTGEPAVVYRPVSLKNLLHHELSRSEEIAVGRTLFPESRPKMDLWSEVYGVAPEKESEQTITIPITTKLNTRILNLAKGAGGDPSMLEGNFWRMLYLSAVSATTLGYGDILPLTTWARIAVSAEAVFGIIIIGLFLNAVSYQWAQKSTGPVNNEDTKSISPACRND